MAIQLDTAALTAVLKQKYTQRRFNLLCYRNNPAYALVNKITDFGGKNKVVAVRNVTPLGRGPTIQVAQANKTASVYNAFVVVRTQDYATASITGEAIKAAKGDENTLIEGLTKEIDGAIHTCMRSLAISMFRNGGGARGQISSATSVTLANGTTINLGPTQPQIQLANLSDVTNFDPGMTVQLASDDGTGGAGLRNGGAQSLTLTQVDRDLGILFASANWNTIVGAAVNDFIFQGAAGVGSDYNSMVKGFAAWLPQSPPQSGDNFFGVPRNTDPTRLAGVRFNGQGAAIEETFIETAARLVREGSSPDLVFMNPLDWSQLVKSLGAKVLYERSAPLDEPDIGFRAVMVNGPVGDLKVIQDLNCPKGIGYMLQMDTWNLESLGEAPMILDFDGNTILRNPTSDTYDVRIGYYGNLTCEAPGWNAVMTF